MYDVGNDKTTTMIITLCRPTDTNLKHFESKLL